MLSRPHVVFVALVLAALALSACSGDGDADPEADGDAPSIVRAEDIDPDATPEPRLLEGTVVTPDMLEVGDCFNQYEATETYDATTTVVDCRRPHDGEVYLVPIHPSVAEDPFPGRIELDRWANATCWEAFEGAIGVEYELSILRLGTILPLQDQWELGLYRQVKCYVFADDGQLSGVYAGSGL